jgi:peptidoglycan hydrolase CwlO-like protein
MIKKTLVAVAGVALLSVLFFGRDAASYFTTTFGWMKDSVKAQVPVEFEIERARRMVGDLLPDIKKNMHVIAQEEVEIERLEKQIAQTEETMTREKAEIMKLKDDLSTVQPVYHYAGRKYTTTQVKVDLANRFERYKTHDALLASLREMQGHRRSSLDAARQKLENMWVAKRQLEVDVAQLEANLKMVQVAQTLSENNIDDSQLGRAKELISEIRTRLKVAERLAQTPVIDGEIPVSAPEGAAEDIVDEVTQYFTAESEPTQVAEADAAPPEPTEAH